MKDGVPIGDCVDPDAASQRKAGCPVSEPTQEVLCLNTGTECRYVHVEGGMAYRITFKCVPNWVMVLLEPCGQACGTTNANTIDFDAHSCAKR